MKLRLYFSLAGDLAYSEIPKCACSTTKQYLFRVGNGRFFEGDIHRPNPGLLGWKCHRLRMRWRLMRRPHYHFTFVRNPYARVLSAFFDKVVNPQADGRMYGKPALRAAIAGYGIDAADDPVVAFRRFVVLVRDTILFGRPVAPDIHWQPMAWHATAPMTLGFDYDDVFHVESYADDLRAMLRARAPGVLAAEAEIRTFNEAPAAGVKRARPVADYFDATSRLLIQEAFRDDFDCFGYALDPAEAVASPLPIAEVNARLQRVLARRTAPRRGSGLLHWHTVAPLLWTAPLML